MESREAALCGLLFRYVLPGALCLAALLPGHGGEAAAGKDAPRPAAGPGSGVQKIRPAAGERDGYGAVLDRMSQERQKKYLESLKGINDSLRSAHAGLVKNYAAYRMNYQRTKQDMQERRATPFYVLKKMQELEAEKEGLESGIKNREAEKKALETEVLAFYRGKLPEEFAEGWNKEEEQYAGYLDAIYRQFGWWMQVEDTLQWRNDESRLWDYLRQYYQDHPEELDILK